MVSGEIIHAKQDCRPHVSWMLLARADTLGLDLKDARFKRRQKGIRMDTGFWDRFYAQLPIDVLVFGSACKLTALGSSDVAVFVDSSVDTEVVRKSQKSFECRKWMSTMVGDTPLCLSECDIPVTSPFAIADFVRFFLRQPIGPQMFTFERSRGFGSYHDRKAAVDQAYLTWFALQYAARRGNGKLKHAIPCSGYFHDNSSMCQKSVLELSGCCPNLVLH
jgi:hypothetical protein